MVLYAFLSWIRAVSEVGNSEICGIGRKMGANSFLRFLSRESNLFLDASDSIFIRIAAMVSKGLTDSKEPFLSKREHRCAHRIFNSLSISFLKFKTRLYFCFGDNGLFTVGRVTRVTFRRSKFEDLSTAVRAS